MNQLLTAAMTMLLMLGCKPVAEEGIEKKPIKLGIKLHRVKVCSMITRNLTIVHPWTAVNSTKES